MRLKLITLNDSAEWDNIVKSFANWEVYYLSGYVRAFTVRQEGEPILIYLEGKTTKAVNVVLKRDLREVFLDLSEPLYDLITPYGYGGFLVEGTEIEDIKNAYYRFCAENKFVSEFVRFAPFVQDKNRFDLYQIVVLGKTISVPLDGEETIWQNFSSKNRNVIRKAMKSGVMIHQDRSMETFRNFKRLYNLTMDKNHADPYYYFGDEFYESIHTDLAHNSTIFYADLDGEMIAASIILFGNQSMHYHLSGSKREFQHLAPTNLLLYEAACWGNRQGFRTFHLGGGVGAKEDSLFSFKKAFYRGEPNEYRIGKACFMPEAYEDLLRRRGIQKGETGFFPEYRA